MMRRLAILILLLIATLALAGPPKDLDWKNGTLAKVWHTHVTQKTPRKTTRFVYTTHYRVESGGSAFQGKRSGRDQHHAGPIDWAVTDEHLYLRDEKGKITTLDREEVDSSR